MLMIVRREGRRLRRYVHLGTGNYHAGTARAYTDLGLLTCSRDIGADVHKVFQELTGLGKVGRLKRLLQSPFTLHTALLQLIDAEIANAQKGKPARIVARMNALAEPEIIRNLYRASQAGVSIDLVIRGICCLRPGVPGVSENIRVRSIIGRFLEHSRVFYFYADGEEKTYLSSADWMQRNFFRRLEVCFPVQDTRLKARVIHESLEMPLSDNIQAWLLQPDGTYRRARAGKQKVRSSQVMLMDLLGEEPGGRAKRGTKKGPPLPGDEEGAGALEPRVPARSGGGPDAGLGDAAEEDEEVRVAPDRRPGPTPLPRGHERPTRRGRRA
jgi:polyphosphate kinase